MNATATCRQPGPQPNPMAKLLDLSRKFGTIVRAFVAAFVLFWAATSGGQIQGHKRPANCFGVWKAAAR